MREPAERGEQGSDVEGRHARGAVAPSSRTIANVLIGAGAIAGVVLIARNPPVRRAVLRIATFILLETVRSLVQEEIPAAWQATGAAQRTTHSSGRL